jgi:dihydrolipoamide dehydrogenase
MNECSANDSPDEVPDPTPTALDKPVVATPPLAELEELLAEPEIDPGNIVDEAEELLRQSAPHDFEFLVIGGGPGGVAAAKRAAQLGLKTGLIEAAEIGGLHLREGLLAKALREAMLCRQRLRQATTLGWITPTEPSIDWPAVRTQAVFQAERHREQWNEELLQAGVEVLQGRARFIREHVIEVALFDGPKRRLNAVHVVIATGAHFSSQSLNGSDLPDCLTLNQLLNQAHWPQHLVLHGDNKITVEIASLFQWCGTQVTVLCPSANILPAENEEISLSLAAQLQHAGVALHTGVEVLSVQHDGRQLQVHYRQHGNIETLSTEQIVIDTTRKANLADLNVEELSLTLQDGQIVVDEHGETNVGGVYAVGDCVHGEGWAHWAQAEGIVVAEVAANVTPGLDFRALPRTYFTVPEVACVGVTAEAAHAAGLTTRTGRAELARNERAIGMNEETGWVQLVVDAELDTILGCQMVGAGATELIHEAALMLRMKMTTRDILDSVYALPSLSHVLYVAAQSTQQ